MISVNFWNFSKRKNSTAIPSGTAVSYSCEIKEPSDLTAPQLLLNLGQSEAPAFTYAQIAAFSRYYFIKEWRFDRGLWIAFLEVDVLASYKSQIGSQSMYVARAASEYDGTIKDSYYPTKSTRSNVSPTTIVAATNFNSGYFVLGILGNNTATGGINYYQMQAADFAFFINKLFVTANNSLDWGDIVQGVVNSVMNPAQYVVSCRWYPNAFTSMTSKVRYIWCGLWNVDMDMETDGTTARTSNVYRLSGSIEFISFTQIAIPKHPLAETRGSYMNLAPFSRYQLIWGSAYEIDPAYIANQSTIAMRLFPDYTSTNAILKIYGGNSALNYEIMTITVPYGVEIPFSATNIDAGFISQIISGAESVGGAVLAVATGNVAGALSMGVAGASSMIQGAGELAGAPISTTNPGTGISIAYQTKYLKATFFDPVDDNVTEFGRPLMKTRMISTLSGFIRCQNDDVTISCLDSERDQIRAFMTGGFFYE